MAFDVNTLPAPVREAFNHGAIGWVLVVQEGIKAGITDVDELADIVFFLHHPERNGKPLQSSEQTLIDQWKSFRTLIKPLVKSAPPRKPGSPWAKQKRHIPKVIYALQYVVLDDQGTIDHEYAFSKVWDDGQRWEPIAKVSDLVKLVKDKCGEDGYVRTLRLGGHGCTTSFRLGNVVVSTANLADVASQIEEILPYFKRGRTLVQLDHCQVGSDRELVKKISRAFGGVAVLASPDDQFTEEDDEYFNGRTVICGPDICVNVPLPNLPTRDLLEILHMHIAPIFENPWSSQ